jgi:perosamine synthetase
MERARLAVSGGKPAVRVEEHVRWPVITDEDRAAVDAVLRRGILSGPFAPEIRALEAEFARYIGAKHALATNSGTAALHLALAAVGVGPGDEVVTTAFSFVATALAVVHQNAVPVFVDIEAATMGMDPVLLEAAITSRTRAIVPVHIHGHACQIEAIRAIGARHHLPVIEDACQAHGVEHQGRKLGSFGAFGAFSLQSSKSLPCGEGGLLVTSDDEAFQRATRMRSFGEDLRPADADRYDPLRALDSDRAYDAVTVGWMYRTNEMSAALARSQLRRLDQSNQQARRNALRLSAQLRELPGITPPGDEASGYHKYRVRVDATRLGLDVPPRRVRDALVKALRAEGVDAVLWQTQPVPGQSLFRERFGHDARRYPQTMRLLDGSLCLFSHTYPIAPQSQALCDQYALAFAKVWNRLDEVLATDTR